MNSVRTHAALGDFINFNDLRTADSRRRYGQRDRAAIEIALMQRAELIDHHGGRIPNNPDPAWGEHAILRVEVGRERRRSGIIS